MRKNSIYTYFKLTILLLFFCVNNSNAYNVQPLNSQNKSYPSFNQLPKPTNAIVDFSIQFEEDDDDTKNKFKSDLYLLHTIQYFKLKCINYSFNYYQSTNSVTNLFNGIAIYAANCSYRI